MLLPPTTAPRYNGGMKKPALLIAIGVAIALLALASFFRYEIVTPSGNRAPYKLDRWTGETTLLIGAEERPVVRVEPNEFDKAFGDPNYQGPKQQ
ncbi:hypothetical protein C7389_1129 [Azoarcus indigens]|uniref:Uncharacterized protein n=1 Tax=Azoarcus indigens TaxID=29545 RepID=A0A4R6DXP6_9RHOO|nr:hypothetical protein C7389_1129 [Azoarcus indigens]